LRKGLCLMMVLMMLSGCSGKDEELDRAIALRMKLLSADCSFDVKITADYGDKISQFSVTCQGDTYGNLAFTVTNPETIAGITGIIDHEGGKLTFDEVALAFPLLAEEQISPVSSPWIFLKTLRGGYLTAAGTEEELLRLTINDSYEEDALQLDIWLDSTDCPVRAEILYDGCRIVTLEIENFRIQ